MKKPKRQLTTWIDQETYDALATLASAGRLTVSELSRAYLVESVTHRAETAGVQLIVPAVEAAVTRSINRGVDRIAKILAVTAIESGQTRGIAEHLVLTAVWPHERSADGKPRRATPDEARGVSSKARQLAVEALRGGVMDEILGAATK